MMDREAPAEHSKVGIRLKVLGARLRRVGSRPTVKADRVVRWRSISPRARRRKYWVVGALSAAIAGQLAVLLVVGGGAPQEAHGSRLGPLNGTSEWSDGGPLRLLSEPLPGFVQRAHELGLGVVGRVPDVIDWHERIPWGLPVSLERGWVSSEFGMRMHPVLHKRCMHEGIDLAVDAGEVVRSTARGVVTFADERGGYGLLVIVDHENGMTTRYAHLSKFLVGVGDHVERGERLGLSGATGRVTGEHLHYEVRIEGEAVNPRAYLPEGLPDERPPGM